MKANEKSFKARKGGNVGGEKKKPRKRDPGKGSSRAE